MKLAIFTDTYLPQINGVARTVDKIYSHLHRKNIDCLLFAPDCGSYSAKSEDLHIYPAFNLPLYPECKIGLPSYSGIRQLLQKFKPDLIHSVTEFSMGLSGLKYAKEHTAAL